MREVVRNTRWACHCGRFVRTAGVTATGYDCTRCGTQQGAAREVVVGDGATVVDVLVSVPGRGRVTVSDDQQEFDYAADEDRILGSPCKPLKCPACGRFSSQSWDTGWTPDENGGWQEWGGVCSTHGRWSDST
jgi:hypothetical protein